METEKKEEAGKHIEAEKRKGTGEQYLYALIKCADWVSKPYKQLAEKNRARPDIMKELYMCACDGVPIEKAMEAQEKNPPEGALRLVRRKFLESETTNEYQEQLTGIKETTVTLEREVQQMSGMLKHIVENVPDFDALFPKEVGEMEKKIAQKQKLVQKGVPKSGTLEQIKSVPKSGTQETEKEDVPEFSTQKQEKENVPKFGTKKRRRLPWEKTLEPAEFIERSLAQGYSSEQLEYLLDCMEEGVAVETIERFSSPKLPVDVMRRLRTLEERKEVK